MWKFIVDVVHDFVSSPQPDVGRGFLHVSNVFLFYLHMDKRLSKLLGRHRAHLDITIMLYSMNMFEIRCNVVSRIKKRIEKYH